MARPAQGGSTTAPRPRGFRAGSIGRSHPPAELVPSWRRGRGSSGPAGSATGSSMWRSARGGLEEDPGAGRTLSAAVRVRLPPPLVRLQLDLGEKVRDLGPRRVGAVGAVDDVVLDVGGEVLPDGARGGVRGVRGPHELPVLRDG